MTTVIAITDGKQTCVAADSLTNVYERPVLGVRKVREFTAAKGEGKILIGFSGDGGGGDALEANLVIDALPKDDQTDRQHWAASIAVAITHIYTEHGFTENGRIDGGLLLVLPGHIWHITHNQAIYQPSGISAIGMGEGPAMGAAHALCGLGTDMVTAARQACEIAIDLDRWSGGPVSVHTTAPA